MTRDYLEDLCLAFCVGDQDEKEAVIDALEYEFNNVLSRNIKASLCPIHDYDVKWCEDCRRKDE